MIDAAATAIRDARIRAGLTQEKAAGLRGHATSTISRWETGGLPQTWAQLDQYARALGQPIVLRFGHNEESPDQSLDWPELIKTVNSIAGEVSAIRGRQDQVASEAVIKLLKVLAPPERLEVVSEMAAELEALLPPSDVAPRATPDTVDQDAAAPEARELG